jgi:hypothetical protein
MVGAGEAAIPAMKTSIALLRDPERRSGRVDLAGLIW